MEEDPVWDARAVLEVPVNEAAVLKLNQLQPSLLHTSPAAAHATVHAQVKGSNGTIFAIGDAATIAQPSALQYAEELFEQVSMHARVHMLMCHCSR